MILFPLGVPIFAKLGPDGISMFYVSCIVSQLVYSLGGSIFRGGIGSEMVRVLPSFNLRLHVKRYPDRGGPILPYNGPYHP